MSTILKALRKLEAEQPPRTLPEPTQLDRAVLEAEASERPRPLRRIALVMIAVLFSGLAGAGVTLAALTFWQTRNAHVRDQIAPPAVAAAPAVSRPSASSQAAKQERSDEPTVVVVADILKQRTAPFAAIETPAKLPPDNYAKTAAEPAPELLERESALVKAAPKTFVSESDAPLPEPLALARKAPPRDPVAELAALREARMSRAPAEVRPPEPVKPIEPVVRGVAAVEIEPPQTEPSEWPELETLDVAAAPVAFQVSVPDPVPTLSVERTTWHPMRHRRRAELSVLEAGKTRTVELKEGEFVGPFKVAEIGPTGVTFLHKGVEIQRRVGAPLQ